MKMHHPILIVIITYCSHVYSELSCPVGTEVSETGCQACPVGYYRAEPFEFCQPCAGGRSTVGEGSTHASNCSVQLGIPTHYEAEGNPCDAGYSLDEQGRICVACAEGSYKSTPGAEPCTPCPLNMQGVPAHTPQGGVVSPHSCLVDIQVGIITPSRVLQGGGDVITISITTNATAVRIDSIHTSRGALCKLRQHTITDGTIECVMHASEDVYEDVITVYVQSGAVLRLFTSTHKLTVLPNPQVNAVHRNTVFISGGVPLTVDVENARSANTMQMIFYHPLSNQTLLQTCHTVTDNRITCSSPDFTDWLPSYEYTMDTMLPTMTVHYGFIFNSWPHYSNLSQVLEGSGVLTLTHDPIVYTITTAMESDTIEMTLDMDSFVLSGNQLAMGTTIEDYMVTVGNVRCDITLLSDATMEVTCLKDDLEQLNNNAKHVIQVSIGNLRYQPGFIRIVSELSSRSSTPSLSSTFSPNPNSKTAPNKNDNNTIIIIAVVLSIFAVVAIIGISIYCVRRSRNKNGQNAHSKSPIVGGENVDDDAGSLRSYRGYLHMDSSGCSSMRSVKSVDSVSLPPLPVQSVFGPHRRTGDGDMTMRHLALPT